MRLLAKTSLYYLILSIPVFAIAGLVSFYLITSEVKESNNELLLKRKSQIEFYLNNNDTISILMIIKSGEATISPVNKINSVQNIFSDTLIFDNQEKEFASNRQLNAAVHTNHGDFLIMVWRSTIEFDELFEGILTALTIILALLFLIFYFINWWIARSLWKPFYKTVETLKLFRAGNQNKPILHNTSIKEFSELNQSVQAMVDKIIEDFNSQKEFTENASHEMQTPLAVIKTKIDLLIQSEKLGEKETDLILAIDDASSKLTRLNKSLLLMTKIENQQFKSEENVSLNKIINESEMLFEEHILAKNIRVTKIINAEVAICINPDLCLVLINNLMQNAIRHNNQNGTIEIKLDLVQFIISNSGKPLPLESNRIFDRFQKNSYASDSIGLGLAIAKKIVDSSGLFLEYKYDINKHHFILTLKK